jgi:hypothetical protein
MAKSNAVPVLSVTDYPVIGAPMIGVQSIPDWIEKNVYPRAPEEGKPLLDIYKEILRLQDMVADLDQKLEAMRVPWYRRFIAWIRRTF